MKTRFIFKTLALVMLMPAMLLTTACSSEDDLSAANSTTAETAVRKGYKLPVTVNVTRQGDGTRAAYNESTRKLAFSSGDKLFVKGEHATAGKFAALLTYESGGAFSGDLVNQNGWDGTVHELFKNSSSCSGYLLPAGYEGYSFYTYTKANEYDATISTDPSHAFALTKAAAVEQFSEEWGSYSYTADAGNFVLEPHNAIVCITINDLPQANTDYQIALGYQYVENTIVNSVGMNKTATTDANGNATFAVGVQNNTHFYASFTLSMGGIPINLINEAKDYLVAGHIYNITRTRSLTSATTADVGKLVGHDGRIYTSQAAVTAGGTTAVAMIAYVVPDGSNLGNSHGLAIALNDEEGEKTWGQANTACGSGSKGYPTIGAWRLPTEEDWRNMFTGCGTVGYATGLNTKLNAVGGTLLQKSLDYWTATEVDTDHAKKMTIWSDNHVSFPYPHAKTNTNTARACLVW